MDPKINKINHWFCDLFWIDFWTIFIMIQHGRGHDFIEKQMFFLTFLLFHCCVVALMSWLILIDFGTHLGSKIDPKSIKNRSKNQSKKWYNFWSILEPTWLHFGRVLGAKLKPNWDQNGHQNVLKFAVHFCSILLSNLEAFWAHLGPTN